MKKIIFSLGLMFALLLISSVFAQYYDNSTNFSSNNSGTNNYLSSTYTIVIGENADSNDIYAANIIANNLRASGINSTIITSNDFNNANPSVISNVISIGGPCVNSVSANILNVDYPTCGVNFQNQFNVGSGQFMIDGVQSNNQNNSTSANNNYGGNIVIAGYNGPDTLAAANYFINNTMNSLTNYTLFVGKTSDYNSMKTTFRISSSNIGDILTDNNGMALYVFDADKNGNSTCYGACAIAWPPVVVNSKNDIKSGQDITAKLNVIKRTDGSYQMTVNGMPVYYFYKDLAQGDINGQGINAFGGYWYVVSPAGTIKTDMNNNSSSVYSGGNNSPYNNPTNNSSDNYSSGY